MKRRKRGKLLRLWSGLSKRAFAKFARIIKGTTITGIIDPEDWPISANECSCCQLGTTPEFLTVQTDGIDNDRITGMDREWTLRQLKDNPSVWASYPQNRIIVDFVTYNGIMISLDNQKAYATMYISINAPGDGKVYAIGTIDCYFPLLEAPYRVANLTFNSPIICDLGGDCLAGMICEFAYTSQYQWPTGAPAAATLAVSDDLTDAII